MSKDELLKKVGELEGLSDEVKVSLMEDIDDTFKSEDTEDTSKIDALEAEKEDYRLKYESLLERYKARFLNEEVEDDIEDKPEDLFEEEKEVIDIKEI